MPTAGTDLSLIGLGRLSSLKAPPLPYDAAAQVHNAKKGRGRRVLARRGTTLVRLHACAQVGRFIGVFFLPRHHDNDHLR